MNRHCNEFWRGAVAGLALTVALPAMADGTVREAVRNQLRDQNYLLIEDRDGARLLLLSPGNESPAKPPRPDQAADMPIDKALAMTRSEDSRRRVRGLTLLSGLDDPTVLDVALVLLADPVAAVREEAVQLLAEHPDFTVDSVIAIAANDRSERVRLIAAELLEERQDESGD